MPRSVGLHPNVAAMLDTLAFSEIGADILRSSDDGYNVLVGSQPDMVITFSSYHRHPGVLLDMDGKSGGLESTAAGRYQLLGKYWKPYRDLLKLSDFRPESQDRIAVQMLTEARALPLLTAGDFAGAVAKCAHLWASLPGAGYGQHENELAKLRTAYTGAGGTVTT
jgi:muramidase (phage lysozyme)